MGTTQAAPSSELSLEPWSSGAQAPMPTKLPPPAPSAPLPSGAVAWPSPPLRPSFESPLQIRGKPPQPLAHQAQEVIERRVLVGSRRALSQTARAGHHVLKVQPALRFGPPRPSAVAARPAAAGLVPIGLPGGALVNLRTRLFAPPPLVVDSATALVEGCFLGPPLVVLASSRSSLPLSVCFRGLS